MYVAFFLISNCIVENVQLYNSIADTYFVYLDEQTSITALFRDPYMWLLSLTFMVVFCAKTTTVDWGQMYLVEEKRHSQHVGR